MFPIPLIPNRKLGPILAEWWKGAGPLRELESSGFLRPLHRLETRATLSKPKPKPIAIEEESSLQELDLSGLFTDLFEELSHRAEQCIQRFHTSAAWQAGELVNEAYVRLHAGPRDTWDNRKHFVNYSSMIMRSLVVDELRSSAKEECNLPLDSDEALETPESEEGGMVDLEALDMAMKRLAEDHPLMAKAIEMRFADGQEMLAIAQTLQMPIRTLERRWRATRSWLQNELE